MNKNDYEKIVSENKPKETRIKNAFIAFVTGGFIGITAEFLIEFYSYALDISSKDAGTFMIVTLIFIASLFTALGFFDNFVNFAKCGLIIPITGFAHSVTSAALEYKREGLIYGIGSNIFRLAGSVILYGIVSAWVFGSIRYLFFGGV